MKSYSTRMGALALALILSSCGGGGDDPVAVTGTVVPPVAPVPINEEVEIVATRAYPNLPLGVPTVITPAGDTSNLLYVAELNGTVRSFVDDPETNTSNLVLDLSNQIVTGSGRGLLGLAFDPNFATNRFFYVYYNATTPTAGQDHRSVVSRFQMSTTNPGVADPSSETVLLSFDQPTPLHDGGCLAFGPDGMLYISSGDGGKQGDPDRNSQNLTSLLGKILRIAPNGSIPGDNPFAGQGGGVRGEIWAYGLRNPWRISFDTTGELWAADVGQERMEEIDLILPGRNYGWNLYEGTLEFENPTDVPFDSTEPPLFTYTHDLGFSVTGGFVYRGGLNASLTGKYLYADFGSGRVWSLLKQGQSVVENKEIANVPAPISFGSDRAGEVLICSFEGEIFRLEERP